MSKLTPEARDLIEGARPDERPPREARARVRARVLARAGAAVATGAAATLVASEVKAAAVTVAAETAGAAGTGVKAVASTGLLLKWIAIVGVTVGVAGTIAVGAGLVPERREPAPASVATGMATGVAAGVAVPAAPSASQEAPAAVVPSAEPRPVSAPSASAPAPRRVASAAVPPAAAPADDGLEAETGLLRKAQEDLRAGRPGSALAALEEHDADFKNGVLHEERLAQHILALCALGRTDEARAEARRFLAASPRSPMAERVRTSCGGDASH